MKKTKEFWQKYKKYILIGVPMLLLVLYFTLGGGDPALEKYAVTRGTVTEAVSLSGKISTSDKADLGFASSGRVGRIYVKNNQTVAQGQLLAQLEIGDLLADLKIKELNSKTSSVDLQAAKEDLEKVEQEEDTKVKNAYRTLLSDDLEAVAEDNDYNVEAPILGGLYDGPEGEYKLRIERVNVGVPDELQILTFGLEKVITPVNKQGSTKVGTRGLYISFPGDDLALYNNTVWYINVPNKTSTSYLSNYNAYNQAREARDRAVKNAEFDYEKLLTEDGGGSSVAQAEIDKIRAEIRKNTIYAPFGGKVTNIEKEVGENASTGERVVSMLGEEKLEVVLQVSELDVSKLVPDTKVKISIDSLPGEDFEGILRTVNSRETEIEGVPVYEAFVELTSDPRIKSGMSANGTIVLAEKANVVMIPTYLIEKENGKNFVQVVDAEGKAEKREITIGLTGTDSMVEVQSGLAAGDTLLVTRVTK